MTQELFKRYRPKRFSDMVGQPEAVSVLQSMVEKNKVPHAIMLSGPSGTGKTTATRILRIKLGCSKHDFYEINASDKNGVGDIRSIKQRVNQAPGPNSKCKIYNFDEAHRLTPEAQDALLKMIEDTPKHVYYIFSTTNPEKIRQTIHTRCTHVKFKPVKLSDMVSLVIGICQKEGLNLKPRSPVIDKLVEVADGSPRKALVLLEQIADLKGEEKQLNVLEKQDLKAKAFQIAQALIYGKKWPEVAKLCKDVEEEPETIRRIILSYANNVVLGGGKQAGRGYLVLEAFGDHWYDLGKAGLTRSAFDVCHAKG